LATQFENHVNDLMRIIIAEVPSHPELAREMMDLIVGRRHRSLQNVLDKLVAQGMLRPHDTALSAKLASGMIKELFVWPALFNADFRLPEDTEVKIGMAANVFLARYGIDTTGQGMT